MDAHSATFTMAVVNDAGKVKRCLSRAMSEANLIEAVSGVVGPKQLTVEESGVAQWVKEVLEGYVERLIICDPRQNRWIAKAEFNDDRRSAEKLGHLLRMGQLKEVVHPDGDYADLRRRFYHYVDLTEQLVRYKNKLKGTYRQVAVPATGESVYRAQGRAAWLGRLDGHAALQRQA
jgi:hypothetical protein